MTEENKKNWVITIKKEYLLPASILAAALIIAGAWIYITKSNDIAKPPSQTNTQKQTAVTPNQTSGTSGSSGIEIDSNLILPPAGVELPVKWGDLGAQMVAAGVIDAQKFEAIYSQRGGLDQEAKNILSGKNNGKLKMTPQNSSFLLNMFWALGLGNKNDVLEKGPMAKDPQTTGRFASTGGWTLAKGDSMSHYSKHSFVVLTSEQQKIVERVSQGVFRPCCGNSTYFPDCNHGMAMLGFLELMASQNVSEDEMYKIALKVNSYWFPDTYLTIAKYLKEKKGISWEQVNAKEVLGADYSAASGYQQILKQVTPPQRQGGGGGCGV